MKFRKFITALLGIAVSAMFIGGCGSASPGTESGDKEEQEKAQVQEKTKEEAQKGQEAAEYPLRIAHAFGETVLEEEPENIVTIGWGNQDTALALGTAPVGVSAANFGELTENSLHPWTDEAFRDLGVEKPVVFDDVDGLDYEAISDAGPDVILASYSGITEEEYNLLSEIAPVVAYPENPWQTTWREQTILNASGMGMQKEGEELVDRTEELIAAKTAEFPELAGTKTAFFWISPDDFSTFYVYLPADPRAAYLTDLGLEFPESVKKMAEGTSEFSITVSRENANELADVEMMVVYGNENLLKALQEDELMSQIPAVKNGAVVLMDENSSLGAAATPSILSIPSEIEEYLKLLSQAREKVK